MTEKQQRALGAKLFAEFPDLSNAIRENCWRKIFQKVREIGRKRILDILLEDGRICSEWAYEWARIFQEDREIMHPFVNDVQWAYLWAREFPEDREIMRPFVNDAQWAYRWACDFPEDREIMRPFVNEAQWAYEWACEFPEDREIMPFVD